MITRTAGTRDIIDGETVYSSLLELRSTNNVDGEAGGGLGAL
jgi:hypothetical protein